MFAKFFLNGASRRTLAVCLAAGALLAPVATGAQPYRYTADRETLVGFGWRNLSDELRNKMTGSYTVASVGDLLWQEPINDRMSPQLRDVLRKADTTFGNLEGQIIDHRACVGSCGYGNNWMPKEQAKALADMGFDIVAPGEFDGGYASYLSNSKYLDEVGIKIGGAGPNLSIARQPVFQELPQGRVGMIHFCPGANVPGGGVCGPAAEDRLPASRANGERPGVNPLGITTYNTVTAEQFAQLKAMRDSILSRRNEADVARPTEDPRDRPGKMNVLGTNYIVGDKPGAFHYEMNADDVDALKLAVRGAKEQSDFLMVSAHVHQNRYAYQAYSQDHYPPNYLRGLIHELIDNGADMFVGHGNHTIQGIEIYKGRPIFYNHGNIGVFRHGRDDSPPNEGKITQVEEMEFMETWLQGDINLVAYVAQTRYQDGKLVEIRIYPADLGVGRNRPWSQMSIPKTPSPALARKILTDLQTYSEPFGTKISIENGIGVIRVPPEATVAVGVNLDIPGRGPGSKAPPPLGTRP